MVQILIGNRNQNRRGAGIAAIAAGVMLGLALTGCAGALQGGSTPTDPGTNETDTETTMAPTTEDLLGTWSSDERGEPRLKFTDDGEVRGSDGCNGIATTYKIEGDRVELESFASTLRACQGVDDWLRGVREVVISGDELIVKDADGEEIGRLQRS